MIASACQTVLELILGELEPDQCLEARAQHRFADVGLRQRIDRGIDVARLALAGDLVANVLGQRRRRAIDDRGGLAPRLRAGGAGIEMRSEEHTSELQSLMRNS